jgi:hypothetical protein
MACWTSCYQVSISRKHKLQNVAHGELDEGHGQPILVLDLDNAVAILGKVMLEFYLIAFERMVRGKTADVG